MVRSVTDGAGSARHRSSSIHFARAHLKIGEVSMLMIGLIGILRVLIQG
jgi:hypothetical protein